MKRPKVVEPPLDRDHILRELTTAAERFVNKAPKQQRLAADLRSAAITSATRQVRRSAGYP